MLACPFFFARFFYGILFFVIFHRLCYTFGIPAVTIAHSSRNWVHVYTVGVSSTGATQTSRHLRETRYESSLEKWCQSGRQDHQIYRCGDRDCTLYRKHWRP